MFLNSSKNYFNETNKWLENAIIALAISGLYSLILVLLRTPQLDRIFSNKSLFEIALVIHVNLSILVWLCSMSALFWSLHSIKTGLEVIFRQAALIGVIFIAISPISGNIHAIMNNYLPMLENILFILGLAIFGVAILLNALQTIIINLFSLSKTYGERLIKINNFSSAIMIILVWLCFYLSYWQLKQLTMIVPLDLDFFYEMLYWSGGHLLQFIYTQLLMLSLLILAEAIKNNRLRLVLLYELLFALNFFLSLGILVGHFLFNLADGEFKQFFTLHMTYTGGLAPSLLIFSVLFELCQDWWRGKFNNIKDNYLLIAFMGSILLFLIGGLMGSNISGVNVTIPAHYHGVIVGITIALMGVAYLICFMDKSPSLSNTTILAYLKFYLKVRNLKQTELARTKIIASWQLSFLIIGQLLHISGLYLAGGYGILRKNPGGGVDFISHLYMGMVGAGGLLAIIAGLIFVLICANYLFFKKTL